LLFLCALIQAADLRSHDVLKQDTKSHGMDANNPAVTGIAIDPSGAYIYTSGKDGTIATVATATCGSDTGALEHVSTWRPSTAGLVNVATDGTYVYVADAMGSIKIASAKSLGATPTSDSLRLPGASPDGNDTYSDENLEYGDVRSPIATTAQVGGCDVTDYNGQVGDMAASDGQVYVGYATGFVRAYNADCTCQAWRKYPRGGVDTLEFINGKLWVGGAAGFIGKWSIGGVASSWTSNGWTSCDPNDPTVANDPLEDQATDEQQGEAVNVLSVRGGGNNVWTAHDGNIIAYSISDNKINGNANVGNDPIKSLIRSGERIFYAQGLGNVKEAIIGTDEVTFKKTITPDKTYATAVSKVTKLAIGQVNTGADRLVACGEGASAETTSCDIFKIGDTTGPLCQFYHEAWSFAGFTETKSRVVVGADGGISK